jgi:hypothetical protein
VAQGARPVVTKKTKASFKEIARTTKRVDKEGDQGKVSTSDTAFRRDAGKVGVKQSNRTQAGTFDADGRQISGRDTNVHAERGVKFGPGGAGGYAALSREDKQVFQNGLSGGSSLGANGTFSFDVRPVSGKTPAQFQIVLTVSVGANVGLSAGADKGKASGSVHAGLEGSISGTFIHTFSAEETAKYLTSLKNHATLSGAKDELDVIQLAAGGSIDDARILLTTLKSGALSVDAVKRLQEGDSASLEAQGKGELGLGASAQRGGIGGKLDVSFSKSGSLKRTVARKGNKVIVTVEVVAGTGSNIGGGLSAAAVSVGVSRAKNEDVGHSVEFELDPNDDATLEERLSQIRGADTADQLRALEARDPAMVGSTTESKLASTTWTPSVGVAGAELALSDTSEYGESIKRTKAGEYKTLTGGHGTGISLGATEGPKATFTETDRLTTTIGPHNRAAGDASTTTTQSDWAGSALSLGEDFDNKPLATTAGLATGGRPVLQNKTEVVGMKLSDADYSAVAAASHDNHAWLQAFIESGMYSKDINDVIALRPTIEAADGDREKIAKALAAFARDNNKTARFVQALVRPAGTSQGGVRYDFPADMPEQEAIYDSLVVDDPLVHPQELAQSGKVKAAIDELNGDLVNLKSLFAKIERYDDKFTDAAAVAEMMNRIGDRETEIRAELRALTQTLQSPAPTTTSDARHPAQVKAPKDSALAQKQAVRNELNDRIDPLIHACLTNRYAERDVFADIETEYQHWYRKADIGYIAGRLKYMEGHLYVEWDKSVVKLREIFKARGDDPEKANEFAPNRDAARQQYNRALKR